MAQHLRTLTALSEDLGLMPAPTRWPKAICNSIPRVPHALLCYPRHWLRMMHRPIQIKYLYAQNKNLRILKCRGSGLMVSSLIHYKQKQNLKNNKDWECSLILAFGRLCVQFLHHIKQLWNAPCPISIQVHALKVGFQMIDFEEVIKGFCLVSDRVIMDSDPVDIIGSVGARLEEVGRWACSRSRSCLSTLCFP